MSLVNNAPIPASDPIAKRRRPEFGKNPDPQEGLVSEPWVDFFASQQQLIEKFPGRVHSVALTSQGASIGATDMTDGTLTAGLYRLTYYARITTAAGVSSSLTIGLDWTDGGVSPTFTGAAMNGNTTTTYQTDTLLIHVDNLSPVRYSTTYASNPAGAMRYSLYLVLEEVEA